ncbi:hypothetical protein HYN48_04075 [Flavobacterium magnum]|uniref:Uncharacterized protein n=1 Tax=Flavobacterium magnum TaxID=2162713 RepID=A0A2S0RCR8_9FLAO|nr:hypothetical protein [Flavobacterium magnum]AWA29329.1 hypothetical protein HYN48_04075 [Flavobacterium magnum]
MKKKLEADLISIAHRILKLKNKSEIDQLYLEAKQLYEKLAVLKFVETHFSDTRPTIGHQEVTESLQAIFDQEEETVSENNADSASAEDTPDTPTTAAATAEPEEETPAPAEEEEAVAVPETLQEEAGATDSEHREEEAANEQDTEEHDQADPETATQEAATAKEDFKPAFDLSFEKKEDEPKETPKQISFEDFLGNYTEPVFEKVSDRKEEAQAPEPEDDATQEEEPAAETTAPTQALPSDTGHEKAEAAEQTPEPAYEPVQPATEKPLRSFTFGLNDRIGFEKHLFGGSSEDMNRVVSQLSTFDSFEEARNFIEDMVKPDYNDWEGKDDYAQRFLDIVERKFN